MEQRRLCEQVDVGRNNPLQFANRKERLTEERSNLCTRELHRPLALDEGSDRLRLQRLGNNRDIARGDRPACGGIALLHCRLGFARALLKRRNILWPRKIEPAEQRLPPVASQRRATNAEHVADTLQDGIDLIDRHLRADQRDVATRERKQPRIPAHADAVQETNGKAPQTRLSADDWDPRQVDNDREAGAAGESINRQVRAQALLASVTKRIL